MNARAFSPAELETLLEDAVVLGDGDAVARLFERDAVIVVGGAGEARGREEIAALGRALWSAGPGYVADAERVACSGDLALVVGGAAVSVARRRRDGSWRFVISVLELPWRGDRNAGVLDEDQQVLPPVTITSAPPLIAAARTTSSSASRETAAIVVGVASSATASISVRVSLAAARSNANRSTSTSSNSSNDGGAVTRSNSPRSAASSRSRGSPPKKAGITPTGWACRVSR